VWKFVRKPALRLLGEPVVVGDDHAALAGGHHLGRIEGEGGRIAPRPRAATIERAALRVRGVLEEPDGVLVAEGADFVHVRRDDAADMDDDHARRLRPDRGAQVVHIHGQGRGVGVDEAHPPARVEDGGGGGEEGIGRDEHFLPLDAEGAERNLDGARAAGDGDGVRDADLRRELLLELPPVLAERQLAGLEDFVDLAENRRTILRREVNTRRGYFHIRCRTLSSLPSHRAGRTPPPALATMMAYAP
jgi:hypothetical protein